MPSWIVNSRDAFLANLLPSFLENTHHLVKYRQGHFLVANFVCLRVYFIIMKLYLPKIPETIVIHFHMTWYFVLIKNQWNVHHLITNVITWMELECLGKTRPKAWEKKTVLQEVPSPFPGGGFKHLFSPTYWRNDPIWLIFFRWVETTN